MVMGQATDVLQDHNSTIKSVAGTIAAMGIDKTGRAGSFLVSPAVWILDFAANGNKPGFLDLSLYGIGFFNPFTAAAATVTGTIKSVVDDDIAVKLRVIQRQEPVKYSKFIKDCYNFNASPPAINAMTIAAQGGTAWQGANGLWVYITDAKGRMVPNYKPSTAKIIYQPKWPLVKNAQGGLIWTVVKP